ncbi:hypothetical protein DFJ58DRAFT_836493 [Suillus subalutaceus]|uniref:uncharacterized protein n=1 Tax=Suillus subalutaceus TaxID=48586 RepID=UPI001B8631C4|nr:uncharacterized protein DFJ58DRAFT_836493 [Suillus subalutaceus]KAG1874785.1 hypothetical protein DFJ58DRAFT_836493 [Suillus subalutaceus]
MSDGHRIREAAGMLLEIKESRHAVNGNYNEFAKQRGELNAPSPLLQLPLQFAWTAATTIMIISGGTTTALRPAILVARLHKARLIGSGLIKDRPADAIFRDHSLICDDNFSHCNRPGASHLALGKTNIKSTFYGLISRTKAPFQKSTAAWFAEVPYWVLFSLDASLKSLFRLPNVDKNKARVLPHLQQKSRPPPPLVYLLVELDKQLFRAPPFTILFGRNKGGIPLEWRGTRESAASSDNAPELSSRLSHIFCRL